MWALREADALSKNPSHIAVLAIFLSCNFPPALRLDSSVGTRSLHCDQDSDLTLLPYSAEAGDPQTSSTLLADSFWLLYTDLKDMEDTLAVTDL